jgi:hypothetical protein
VRQRAAGVEERARSWSTSQHLLHVQLRVVVLRDAGRPQRKVFVALNQTAEIEAGMAKN